MELRIFYIIIYFLVIQILSQSRLTRRLLHGALNRAHFHSEVVDCSTAQDEGEEEASDVGDVDAAAVRLGGRQRAQRDAQRDGQEHQRQHRERGAAQPRHARAHRRHLAAVRAAHRRVLQQLVQKCVLTVSTDDPAHARQGWHRWSDWRGCQVDDPLTVCSGAGNAL